MLSQLRPRKRSSLRDIYQSRVEIENWLIDEEAETQILDGDLLTKFIDWVLDQAVPAETGLDDIGDGSALEEEDADTEFRDRCRLSLIGLLQTFAGKILTRDRIRSLAITVSGRSPEFSKGQPCMHWDGIGSTPGVVFISDIRRLEQQQERLYDVAAEVHTGKLSGIRWYPRMSGTYIQILLRDIGARKYGDWHDEDISGLWLDARIGYEKSRLRILSAEVPATMQAYNRKLTNARTGICPGPSERKGKRCTVCEVGRQQCPLSRFAASYNERRQCVNGHPGWFRYGDQVRCLTCLRTGRMFSGPPKGNPIPTTS